MPQTLGDELRMLAFGDKQRCVSVTKVVEAHLRQSGIPAEALEMMENIGNIERRPNFRCENKVIVHPPLAGSRSKIELF